MSVNRCVIGAVQVFEPQFSCPSLGMIVPTYGGGFKD